MAFRHMVIFTLFFLSILKVSQAMVFRHVVMFKYIPTVTEEQKQAVLDGLAGLPAQIPSIRSYSFGTDAGVSGPANFDVAIVADFDSEEGYKEYANSPAHVSLVTNTIKPVISSRSAVQYEVGAIKRSGL